MTAFAPRFVYGSGPTTLDLAQRLEDWGPEMEKVGEADETASGIPTSYTIRTDQITTMVIVFSDAEMAGVWAFLDWAMGPNRSFWFYFNQEDAATGVLLYLVRPRVGERVRPRREPIGDHWTLELEARRVAAGGPINVPQVG